MVIGMLVVLSILAATTATTVARMRDDQLREDARVQGLIDAQSTRATVLYLLATQRMTFAGLTVDQQMVLTPDEKEMLKEGEAPLSNMPVGNEIRLDGKLYRGLGTSDFSLQDDRGLLSINWSNPLLLTRWLNRLNVPVEAQPALWAKLLDYQDPDDLTRLNGGEADLYRSKGRPGPPNRPLLTPFELRDVMGWSDVLKDMSDNTLVGWISASQQAQICVNTAPARVLALLPGVTEDMANRVIDYRKGQAITDEVTLSTLLPGLPLGTDLVGLHPGASGTLLVWPNRHASGLLVHWTLTPFDNGGRPWHVDYETRFPARQNGTEEDIQETSSPLLADPVAAHPR